MKTIGLFGGTFDPVHLGHRYILEAALKALDLEKVIVMPAKIPPHKSISGFSTEKQRFEMCRLAFSDLDKVEVSDYELRNECKSYSFYTVSHIKEMYPDHKICFIMGSDQLMSFRQWYRYSDLLSMATILSVSRDDEVSDHTLKEYAESLIREGGDVITLSVKPFEISSTQIREDIKNNIDCSCYLDKNVVKYILDNSLYKIAPLSGDKLKASEKALKNIDFYKTYIKNNLSKKRAQHSFNVADAAVRLAKQYGADVDKAYLAGLLHDVCKEMPSEKQKELALRCTLDVSEAEKLAPPLFHAVAGSVFVQEEFRIHDPDIVKAIRYHTVACGNMDKLSQIIYLADLISDDRDYKDVKKMRKYAEQSLEKAMLEALKFSISDSVGKENIIPPSTFECYNDFVKLSKLKGGK